MPFTRFFLKILLIFAMLSNTVLLSAQGGSPPRPPQPPRPPHVLPIVHDQPFADGMAKDTIQLVIAFEESSQMYSSRTEPESIVRFGALQEFIRYAHFLQHNVLDLFGVKLEIAVVFFAEEAYPVEMQDNETLADDYWLHLADLDPQQLDLRLGRMLNDRNVCSTESGCGRDVSTVDMVNTTNVIRDTVFQDGIDPNQKRLVMWMVTGPNCGLVENGCNFGGTYFQAARNHVNGVGDAMADRPEIFPNDLQQFEMYTLLMDYAYRGLDDGVLLNAHKSLRGVGEGNVVLMPNSLQDVDGNGNKKMEYQQNLSVTFLDMLTNEIQELLPQNTNEDGLSFQVIENISPSNGSFNIPFFTEVAYFMPLYQPTSFSGFSVGNDDEPWENPHPNRYQIYNPSEGPVEYQVRSVNYQRNQFRTGQTMSAILITKKIAAPRLDVLNTAQTASIYQYQIPKVQLGFVGVTNEDILPVFGNGIGLTVGVLDDQTTLPLNRVPAPQGQLGIFFEADLPIQFAGDYELSINSPELQNNFLLTAGQNVTASSANPNNFILPVERVKIELTCQPYAEADTHIYWHPTDVQWSVRLKDANDVPLSLNVFNSLQLQFQVGFSDRTLPINQIAIYDGTAGYAYQGNMQLNSVNNLQYDVRANFNGQTLVNAITSFDNTPTDSCIYRRQEVAPLLNGQAPTAFSFDLTQPQQIVIFDDNFVPFYQINHSANSRLEVLYNVAGTGNQTTRDLTTQNCAVNYGSQLCANFPTADELGISQPGTYPIRMQVRLTSKGFEQFISPPIDVSVTYP